MALANQLICDTTEEPELAAFWQSLERTGCMPMQQYIWSQACYETLPLDGDLQLVMVKTETGGGAIAPLVRRRESLHRLEHLGWQLFEPADFIYSDANALKELAAILARQESSLLLSRIPADMATVRAVQDAYRGRGRVFVRPGAPFPRIVLSEAWLRPEQQLNSGRRSDFRRSIRHAEKIGTVRYEVLSPTREELKPLLDKALEIEAANWKGREGTAISMDTLRGPFFRRYATLASHSGCLRLCFLYVGETAVGMQFAIECGGSFWLLKIGYRDEFARCSPGMLLIAETIRYATARGLASYEFLRIRRELDKSVDAGRAPVPHCASVPLARARNGGPNGGRLRSDG